MRATIYLCLFLLTVSCHSVRLYKGGFFFPEPCSLIEKSDITSFFTELPEDEIQISISIDMVEDTKLCAYNWVNDYKENFIMDIYLTGMEGLQSGHPRGKIDYFTKGQHNPEVMDLGDTAVFIPNMHDKGYQRLSILKGNFALDIQSKNIDKSILISMAEQAISRLP